MRHKRIFPERVHAPTSDFGAGFRLASLSLGYGGAAGANKLQRHRHRGAYYHSNMRNTHKVARSAKTGRFVKPSFAKSHPNTTVVETVKRTKKPAK